MCSEKLKSITLNLPENWNSETDPFKKFVLANYLDFCSESNNKELFKKANKIRKASNPKICLLKEYEKLKYRLWYFFDLLFENELNDDHKNYWFDKIKLEAIGLPKKTFKPIYSQTIKDLLGYRFKSFFMKYLESERLISIDHQYIPEGYAFSNNAKPKSYRLSHYAYSRDVKIVPTKVSLPKNEYKRLYKTRQPKKKKREKYIDKLESHFSEWSINPNLLSVLNNDTGIPQEITEEFIQEYLSHESNYWLKHNTSFGRRVYHKNLQLDKRLRKYLDHKSMFNKQISKKYIIEHRNCMIYLFCCELVKFNIDDKNYIQHLELLEKLDFSKTTKLNNRSILVEAYIRLINDNDKEPLINFISKEFEFSQIEIKKLKKIIYCGAQKNHGHENATDIWTLLMISKLGIIYDVLKQLYDREYSKPLDLKVFKEKFISYLNGEVIKIPHIKIVNLISKLFEKYFPNFHSNLIYEKRNDHKTISFRSFRSESLLMIENVAKELINDHKIHFITIHDGIMCYQKDAEYIKNLVEHKSKLLFGITSPIDIEPVS